jgi:hypothetical protein
LDYLLSLKLSAMPRISGMILNRYCQIMSQDLKIQI